MKVDIRDKLSARSAEELKRRYDFEGIEKKLPVYPISVDKGGTGKTSFMQGTYLTGGESIGEKTPAEVLTDIGAESREILLWTNPNSASAFSAQTVNLPENTHAGFKLIYINSVGDGLICSPIEVEVGQSGAMTAIGGTVDFLNGYWVTAARKFTTTQTNFVFTACSLAMKDVPSMTSGYNGVCIPYKIYGIH